MLIKTMSLSARRELLASVREKYQAASWNEKGKILNGFVAATGYGRKHAIQLLNDSVIPEKADIQSRYRKYDDQVRQALVSVWYVANQICAKRLVPFLPELVRAMERHDQLRLPPEVRQCLLNMSPATADRLLRPERQQSKLNNSTTRTGNLLKHQIQIRTFADWNDVIPGFLEADLVAHCGGNPNGSFLNTLVLVDIATGWLEVLPLLKKGAQEVIDGLRVVEDLLPFPLQGLDTDCGSEFINYDLLDYCEDKKITFTRARTYRKNDQAHVEEKNGSVVRRLVGYDRFEGQKAWQALAQLYRVLRKYINYFQPSAKLIEKSRDGAKVTKKYDAAKTPYQRVLLSKHVEQQTKEKLTVEYESLDPVNLLAQLEQLQDQLWGLTKNKSDHVEELQSEVNDEDRHEQLNSLPNPRRGNRYYRVTQGSDLRKQPRTWRTRKDPFDMVWDEIKLRLELMPETTAKALIEYLMIKYPEQFSLGHLRTLQRRISVWRLEQQGLAERLRILMVQNQPEPALARCYASTEQQSENIQAPVTEFA